jgi:hypothetical protein
MVSSSEAFDRFWMWKNTRTLLNVTLWEKGKAPVEFLGAVSFPDEDSLVVGFLNHDTRSPVPPIRFEDCTFRLGDKILFADRAGEEFFECEDTGKIWTPVKGL